MEIRPEVYTYTSDGGRAYNEDCAGSRLEGARGIFVLADGLGGYRDGEKASRCIVDALLAAWDAEKEKSLEADWLEERMRHANETLIALQKELQSNMKSTAVVLAVEGDRARWAHVGDSRLYYLTAGRIFCLTEDHSVTWKKYRSGQIRKRDVNFDEDRSSLLRVMGDEKNAGPDAGETAEGDGLRAGDAFLLCSDGFWEYLYEEEILIDYLKAESAEEWGTLLLLRVMERIRPQSDNLTFTAVWFKEEKD